MSDPVAGEADVAQAAVDAAFPYLHGAYEFKSEPSLRKTLELPVRRALAAAGLAEVTAERDRLKLELQAIAMSEPEASQWDAIYLVNLARKALDGEPNA